MSWLIVDGHYMLHRCCRLPDFAVMRSSAGVPSGGVYGFLHSLRRAIEAYPTTRRVIVAWDIDRSQRRLALFPEYKGNREPKDAQELEEDRKFRASFAIQLSLLKRNLIHLGVRQVALPGREGDDVIACVCRLFGDATKVVVTGDKDFFQLVNPSTRVYRVFEEEEINVGNFRQVTGASSTETFLVGKAALGDPSDGIPGIQGVGEKTVRDVLEDVEATSFAGIDEAIEAVMDACEGMPRTKKGELQSRYAKLYEGRETINRNLELIDMSREPFSQEERDAVRYYAEGGMVRFDRQKTLGFLASLDMNSILRFFHPYEKILAMLS